MQSLLNQARKRCLSEIKKLVKISTSANLLKNSDLRPSPSYLKRQSIEYMTLTVTLMFV